MNLIQKHSHDPLTEGMGDYIAGGVGIKTEKLVLKFKQQLYTYLQTYTKGTTKRIILDGGEDKSWESWRQLCDGNYGMRNYHLRLERKRLFHPQQAKLDQLKKAIAKWERDLLEYKVASGEGMKGEEQRTLCLEEMCPQELQDHLAEKHENGHIKSYDSYKQAINNYIHRKSKDKVKGKFNVVVDQ